MSAFPYAIVTSYEDATRNLEQMREQGVTGIEVPVMGLGDLTRNFEQIQKLLNISLPHVPPESFLDVTHNFETLEANG